MVATSVLPLAFSNRNAWMQYGQTAVEYIVTVGTSLLHGQPGVLPCLVAAAQIVDIREAKPPQYGIRRPRSVAHHAVDDDGFPLVARELPAAARELRERDVERTRQPASLVLLGLPDVEQHRVRRIDETRRFERADVAPR